jgi:predicted HNH restriction endonuclease
MTKDKRKYADRAEYLKAAVDRRRKQIRQLAIEYKGGECSICSYNKCLKALEFHHLDSSKKDFGISAKGYTRSWMIIKKELDKCILLCANCHREVHEGVTQLPQVIEVEERGELLEA